MSCIETIVGSAKEAQLSDATVRRVGKVFAKYSELLEAMHKKADDGDADGAGKKKRKSAAASAAAVAAAPGDGAAGVVAATPSAGKAAAVVEQLLGVREMHLLLHAVAKDKQDTVSQFVRDNKLLHRWIVSQVLQLSAATLGSGGSEEESVFSSVAAGGPIAMKRLEFCQLLGPLVMAEYKRDSDKEVSVPLAEALLLLVEYVASSSHNNQSKLAEFLEAINQINVKARRTCFLVCYFFKKKNVMSRVRREIRSLFCRNRFVRFCPLFLRCCSRRILRKC